MKITSKSYLSVSHAAAYATVAYITAWLKYHYPTEFYISTLEFSDVAKYPELIAEAKEFGVIVHGPDIERSKASFSGKNHEIYFGFSGIKGIGDSVKSDGIICNSFSDFILKTDLSASTVKTLIESGAFDRKVKNRKALLTVLPDYYDQKDIIKKKSGEIDTCKEMLSDLSQGIALDRKKYSITTKSLPTADKIHLKISTCEEKIYEATETINQIVIPCEQVMDNVEENLETEKNLIGMYASGHPLDPYGTPEEHDCISIQNLDEPEDKYSYSKIFGKVVEYRHVTTKKSSEDMCFFKVMDQTGTIDVCCFAKSYKLCGDQIKEGAVMMFLGKKSKKRGADEETFQFILENRPNAAQRIYDKKGAIMVALDGIDHWADMQFNVMSYAAVSGHPLKIYDENTGAMYDTEFRVSGNILTDKRFVAKLIA